MSEVALESEKVARYEKMTIQLETVVSPETVVLYRTTIGSEKPR